MQTKKRQIIKWILLAAALLWCSVIFGFSLADAGESTSQSGFMLNLLNSIPEALGLSFRFTSFFVRKLAHFTEFFILGVLTAGALVSFGCKRSALFYIPTVLAVASADETIQLFVPGRAGQLADVLLDFSGGFSGGAVLLVILYFVFRIRKSKTGK